MERHYVILGHSTIDPTNKRFKAEKFPNNGKKYKLILPVKCGQSLQGDELYQHIFFYNNILNKFVKGENVINNIKKTLTPKYFNILNNRHNLTKRGIERNVYNKTYPNQQVQFSAFKPAKPMQFGVFSLNNNKPFNIMSKINLSVRSIAPRPVNKTIGFSVKELINIISQNVKARNTREQTKTNKVSIMGHYCRALKGINFPSIRHTGVEVTNKYGKEREYPPKTFKRLLSARRIKGNRFELGRHRSAVQKQVVHALAAVLKTPPHKKVSRKLATNK